MHDVTPQQSPKDVVHRCSIVNWSGPVWRAHGRRYEADNPGGSRRRSARFHLAPDLVAPHVAWTALYTALQPETCLGEILRHTAPEMMSNLNSLRISQLAVQLTFIVDFRELMTSEVLATTMMDAYDYTFTQLMAQEAIYRGAEAILVPSATRLGDNLVIFPDHLRPDSRLEVIGSRDPVLYVERE